MFYHFSNLPIMVFAGNFGIIHDTHANMKAQNWKKSKMFSNTISYLRMFLDRHGNLHNQPDGLLPVNVHQLVL